MKKRIDYDNGYYVGEVNYSGDKHGVGTYVWYSGGSYTGEYKYDRRNGVGIYYYPNGDRYEGEWVNGDRTGFGTMFFTNGNYYRGQFVNNKYQGQGEFHWANGAYIVATFQNDVPIQGTHYFSHNSKWAGDKCTGYFVNWKLHGQCFYVEHTGASYYCLYDNGNYVRKM